MLLSHQLVGLNIRILYLHVRESEFFCQLSSLGRREVFLLLELLLEVPDLLSGEGRARLLLLPVPILILLTSTGAG